MTRVGARRVYVDGTIVTGDLSIDGAVIAGVHAADARDLLAVPGFVDLQVNGYAGIDYASADLDGYRRADRAMLAAGVTSYQPTLVTLPRDDYAGALATAAAARSELDGGLIGVHAEGPFLNPDRAGAHDPASMQPVDLDLVDQFLAAGVLTQITIAPELAKATDAIRRFVEAGVVVSMGHSEADAAAARDGIDAGAKAVTHLFNAMRPHSHRHPGLVGVALDDQRLTITIIVDGHHLDPSTVRLIDAAAGDRVALITDAIAATGTADGTVQLGNQTVTVVGGRAALADGTLAGSVLTMDRAVRNVVASGITLERAIGAATTVPARLAGLSDRADLTPGTRADITLLDRDLSVVRVYRSGTLTFER